MVVVCTVVCWWAGCLYSGVLVGWLSLQWCVGGLDHSGSCVYSGVLVGWITVVAVCTVVCWWAGSQW